MHLLPVWGSSVTMHLSPRLGSSRACVSVPLSLCMSLYLSVRSPASLFGNQSARPVFVHSACGHYIYSHIYIYQYKQMHRDAVPPRWKCVCIHFQFGSPAPPCIYPPDWGTKVPSGVQPSLLVCVSIRVQSRLLVCVYFCLSVWSSALLFGHQSVRPIIICSACGRYIYVYIHDYIYIHIYICIYINIYKYI